MTRCDHRFDDDRLAVVFRVDFPVDFLADLRVDLLVDLLADLAVRRVAVLRWAMSKSLMLWANGHESDPVPPRKWNPRTPPTLTAQLVVFLRPAVERALRFSRNFKSVALVPPD